VAPEPSPRTPERVVIVGFMGAGKSTVGPLVAARLQWTFLDLDGRIEERTGRAIADIFAADGEPAFRAIEREAALEAAGLERVVIAAGGGAFAQPATRAALQAGAVTVWLRCDFESLARRVPADGRRPLAANREIMRSLLADRESSYLLADVVVDASSAPDVVADRVVEQLCRRGVAGALTRP
jgi:shikimate kinase